MKWTHHTQPNHVRIKAREEEDFWLSTLDLSVQMATTTKAMVENILLNYLCK